MKKLLQIASKKSIIFGISIWKGFWEGLGRPKNEKREKKERKKKEKREKKRESKKERKKRGKRGREYSTVKSASWALPV